MYLRTTNYMEACLHFNERRGPVNSLFMLALAPDPTILLTETRARIIKLRHVNVAIIKYNIHVHIIY